MLKLEIMFYKGLGYLLVALKRIKMRELYNKVYSFTESTWSNQEGI